MISGTPTIIMLYPWVNIVLLVLIVLQFVTGYFGLTNGRPPAAWILWLHGIGAYALILIMLLKAGIILDAWRRKSRWTRQRVGFAILLILLLISTALGLIWTFAGPSTIGGFSLVSLHIYIAIPVLLLMAWHAWRMRFIWRLPETTDRRLFIGSIAAAAGGLLVWRTADRVKALQDWPGASRRFTGSYETGSYTGLFPSVSWIADRPGPVNLEQWTLRIEGVVERPYVLTYADLLAMPQREVEATLDCTGGWYTTQVWRGVRVGDLLARAGLRETAASVTFEAVSGYKRRFSLGAAEDYLLALGLMTWPVDFEQSGVNEQSRIYRPLTHGNGSPVRLVAPDERGVEWVKWVGVIRVNETGPNWQLPLPLQ